MFVSSEDTSIVMSSIIGAIKKSKLVKIANFTIHDSLSINIDKNGGKFYLFLIKDRKGSNGVVLTCKYKNGITTVLDVNNKILRDIEIGSHDLVKESDSTCFLRSEYGQGLQSGNMTYLIFNPNNPEAVFVDSLILYRNVFDGDNVHMEQASLTQKDFGKLRLKNLPNNIWTRYDVVFKNKDEDIIRKNHQNDTSAFVKKSDWNDVECKEYQEADGYVAIQECIFPNATMQQVYNIVKRVDPNLKTELPATNMKYRSIENGGFPEIEYQYKSKKHLFIELGYAGGETTIEIIENENGAQSKIRYSPD
jgi:hypothetical protein